MPISVLATRCRHCGAEVARPRKKEASLTIHDLGGDQVNTYRPSGNVMEAIEAFRAEVQSADVSVDPMQGMGDGGMPQLDEHSRAMLSAVLGDPEPGHSNATPRPRPSQSAGLPRGVVWGGLTALGVICLAWGAQVAMSMINQSPVEMDQPVNPAPGMIAMGGDPLEVLQAASQALQHTHSEENLRIMDEARGYLLAQVNELLNATPWEPSLLERASRLSNQAVRIDPHDSLRSLRERVLGDVNAYGIKLKLNPDQESVTLDYRDPAIPDETGGVDDLLAGRFLVKSISQHQVRLEDTLVKGPGGNRMLIYWVRDGRLQGM
jgi:hypothetical protein